MPPSNRSDTSPDPADAHVPNIGRRGVRRRRLGGVVWLLVGIVAAVLLARHDAGPAELATLVVPFTLAALGFLQARERT